MRKRFLVLAGMLWLFPALMLADQPAAAVIPLRPVLNQVKFQVSGEQWVTTKTAQVVVAVNATLNEDQLAKAHADILQKLNKLASADWHITQFDRSADQSGLEQLQVLAETRLSEAALTNLREQAKDMSKPGETFTVQNINFVPTLAEVETARTQLRAQIYNQVQTELAQLNKIFPNQRYVVHTINFNQDMRPAPAPKMLMAMSANAGDNTAAPIVIANKIQMTAIVNLASVNQ